MYARNLHFRQLYRESSEKIVVVLISEYNPLNCQEYRFLPRSIIGRPQIVIRQNSKTHPSILIAAAVAAIDSVQNKMKEKS